MKAYISSFGCLQRCICSRGCLQDSIRAPFSGGVSACPLLLVVLLLNQSAAELPILWPLFASAPLYRSPALAPLLSLRASASPRPSRLSTPRPHRPHSRPMCVSLNLYLTISDASFNISSGLSHSPPHSPSHLHTFPLHTATHRPLAHATNHAPFHPASPTPRAQLTREPTASPHGHLPLPPPSPPHLCPSLTTTAHITLWLTHLPTSAPPTTLNHESAMSPDNPRTLREPAHTPTTPTTTRLRPLTALATHHARLPAQRAHASQLSARHTTPRIRTRTRTPAPLRSPRPPSPPPKRPAAQHHATHPAPHNRRATRSEAHHTHTLPRLHHTAHSTTHTPLAHQRTSHAHHLPTDHASRASHPHAPQPPLAPRSPGVQRPHPEQPTPQPSDPTTTLRPAAPRPHPPSSALRADTAPAVAPPQVAAAVAGDLQPQLGLVPVARAPGRSASGSAGLAQPQQPASGCRGYDRDGGTAAVGPRPPDQQQIRAWPTNGRRVAGL